MADTISTKRITDLPEDTDVNDNDLFMAGSNGTASLRKKKWSTLLAKIKSVLLANNLTTTAAGYALDARQGKALKDQLDQQNTNMQDYSYNTGSNYTYICSKVGRIVVLMATIETTSKANIQYFTLPDKYRPKFDLFVPATRTGSGTHGFATIRASGAVSLFPETVGWNTFSVAFIS